MKSIRSNLLFALLVTGLLPLAIIYFVTGNKTAVALKKGEFEKIREMAVQVAGQLESVMARAADDLQSLSTNPFLADLNASESEQIREMNRLVGVYDLFSDITLYDPEGYILLSTTESQPENYEHSIWFKQALKGTRTISDPHKVLNDPTGRLYLSVFIPVMREAGEVAKVVKARIPFDAVWQLFDRVSLGKQGYMTLIDSRGNYLAHRNKEMVLKKFDDDFETSWWEQNPIGIHEFQRRLEGRVVRGVKPSSAQRSLYVALVLPEEKTRVGHEWTLIAFEPEEEVNILVDEQRRYQLGVGLATFVFVVGLGYVLGTVFSRPLIQASAVAGSVARGETATKIPDAGPKEVRELAESFNLMADEVRHHRDHLELLVETRTKRLAESQGRLEELSAQLRSSYDAAAEAILVVGTDGKVIAANRRVEEFFGEGGQSIEGADAEDVRRLLGGCFRDGGDFEEMWGRMATRREAVEESEWTVSRPRELILSLYSAPVRGGGGDVLARLWMFRDLTEQRQLQANLEQAQKMEAIGRLAGGVAHDFNNLLTGITGNLSLIELDASDGEFHQETDGYLQSAKKASQRAADLVRQLLGFSRRSALRMRRCDVGDIITEVQDLLSASIPPDIEIEVEVEPGLWSIEADSTQIQQVLMNMCVNARDAFPEGKGKIVMSAENSTLEPKEVALHGAEGAEFVRFSITDNGGGIPPEVLAKIWEPFFTTKEQGKGTGLGLATSYGIVQQHGGWIECESEVGKGTTFDVFVPRRDYGDAEVEEEKGGAPVERGTETVLLVDDEVMVRTVAQGFLKRQGYETMSASDGLEAVEIIQERGGEIGLVLLDLTMPRLSGKDTFRKIREMHPDMPVVICSGYLLDVGDFEEETGFRPSGIVQKPYETDELFSAVRDAIDWHASEVGKRDEVET